MKDGVIQFFDHNYQLANVKVREIVIEQDTAITHIEREYETVDYNRSGMPICEITTEPDINHPEDAKLLVEELQQTLRHLTISRASMRGHELRIDTNISLKRISDDFEGPRVEVVTIQRLDDLTKAINFEIVRQHEYLSNGKTFKSEDRIWDS